MKGYTVVRTVGNRVLPYPIEVRDNERLTEHDRDVWVAMAVFADESGRPWTTAAERRRTRADSPESHLRPLLPAADGTVPVPLMLFAMVFIVFFTVDTSAPSAAFATS